MLCFAGYKLQATGCFLSVLQGALDIYRTSGLNFFIRILVGFRERGRVFKGSKRYHFSKKVI